MLVCSKWVFVNRTDSSAQISHFSLGFVGEAEALEPNGDAGEPEDAGTILVPSNIPSDVCVSPAVDDLLVEAGQTIDIDTADDATCDLKVTGMAPEICVIKRRHIVVAAGGTLTAHGARAIAFVATEQATIDGTLDVSAKLSTHGPGAPDPAGAAGPSYFSSFAGAGGGYGTAGGMPDYCGSCPDGSCVDASTMYGTMHPSGVPGAAYGSAKIVPLRGGAAGANTPYATDGGLGAGGGGGGALEFVCCASLRIGATGRILAGGGGGRGGPGAPGCGGNGGGGGSGGGSGIQVPAYAGNDGANGSDSVGPAPGGARNPAPYPGSPGRSGGAASVPPEGTSYRSGNGGAGGAVGRVRINVLIDGGASVNAGVFSPNPTLGGLSRQ